MTELLRSIAASFASAFVEAFGRALGEHLGARTAAALNSHRLERDLVAEAQRRVRAMHQHTETYDKEIGQS